MQRKNSARRKITHVAVIGAGTGGLLAALGIRKINPHIKVTVIHSSKVPVIGVGESTQPNLPHYLHYFLELPFDEFYREVRPTWKLGLRFNWGKRDHFNYPFMSQFDYRPDRDLREPGFYCGEDVRFLNIVSAAMEFEKSPVFKDPNGGFIMHYNHAYHIENRRLVAYLMTKLSDFGINVVDAEIQDFNLDEQGYVKGVKLTDQKPVAADLWIDSSGFSSLLLAKTLDVRFLPFTDKLFCERAVVGGYDYDTPDEPIRPYTAVDTMNCGWCFTIDHDDISNSGYVFSNHHISDDEATAEFLKFRPRIKNTHIIPFRSGRYEHSWVRNVIGIGNAAGFVEPLEATALALICRACINLAFTLNASTEVTDSMIQRYNDDAANAWDITRDFITLHYAFNNRINNEFWRTCQAELQSKLGYYQPIHEFYKRNGPTSVMAKHLLKEGDFFKLDGFLTLAIGMKVPHNKRIRVSRTERQSFDKLRAGFREQGENALDSRAAFKIVHDPRFNWPAPSLPDHFQQGW